MISFVPHISPLVQNFYIFSFQYQDATAEEEGEFDEEEGEEEA